MQSTSKIRGFCFLNQELLSQGGISYKMRFKLQICCFPTSVQIRFEVFNEKPCTFFGCFLQISLTYSSWMNSTAIYRYQIHVYTHTEKLTHNKKKTMMEYIWYNGFVSRHWVFKSLLVVLLVLLEGLNSILQKILPISFIVV